jgi:neurotransmitter:Na+ symporter, NSS family
VTMTGLATASTNQFAEVVLGGTIAIPAAVTFFGLAGATAIAAGGSFDIGIVAMAVVFQGLPGGVFLGQLAGFMWFFLLFIAGITSSVALASPAMAFLQEEFGIKRTAVALFVGGLALVLGLANVWWYQYGFLDEWDYWAGTFGLVVFAFIEIWILRLAFGMDRFWEDLHQGADLRVSRFFLVVMKWIAPPFITLLLVWWTWTEAWPTLMMADIPPEDRLVRWGARLLIVGLLALGMLMVRTAWKRRAERGELEPAIARGGVR